MNIAQAKREKAAIGRIADRLFYSAAAINPEDIPEVEEELFCDSREVGIPQHIVVRGEGSFDYDLDCCF